MWFDSLLLDDVAIDWGCWGCFWDSNFQRFLKLEELLRKVPVPLNSF